MWGDQEIAEISSISIDHVERDVVEWQKEWSITVDFSWDDLFSEMILLRLQAEMYVEQFKN